MDVVWLQRDFGLYLVGLFDTGQAARVLGMAHLSLAFLLKHYCRLEADKKFQLADWRIRQVLSLHHYCYPQEQDVVPFTETLWFSSLTVLPV